MFTFLLVIQTLVALAMVAVILMQRSEGGGLTGGSPSGLMTARGAADFLTRATAILATIFVALSIVLAALAANAGGPRRIDPSLIRQQVPQQGPTQPVPGAAPAIPGGAPGAAPGAAAPPAAAPGAAAPAPVQQPPQGNTQGVPLAQ
ncbi:MAG TPA: preprotein translocase subunit SecG [Allosphingosinicella sp.]